MEGVSWSLKSLVPGMQGEFAMLIFGVTRNFEEARSRLENLTEIVRQAGRPISNIKAELVMIG